MFKNVDQILKITRAGNEVICGQWKNGLIGKLEEWKNGLIGRMEEWKNGKLEEWICKLEKLFLTPSRGGSRPPT